ncbi:MAG: insulinase family protein [Phaeodactylibacter sp.]|nr:insulinase family protein [Phaeodactylibacter sp.]MCB9049218.1 insulinase family protein [Lewinellaceae bacterium]
MENRMILWLAALFLGPLAFGQATLQLPYQIHTLPNGLTVILHEDHSVPMVAVNVWYHVGSGYEKPGRTGFAHLFEHLMFEGSGNVAEGDFDNLLESVGGNNNGSTNTDRTNYYEILPSSALDIALFLESDRMGYLLNAMSPEKVDGQRDVVKNERRQSYENRPYGMSWIKLQETLYPKGHPYNWPTIGYMEDLTAASYEDVVDFFNRYYCPKNASLVIAGDIDPEKTLERVKYWFAEIPAGEEVLPPQSPNFSMEGPEYLTLEDKVQLPRLYLAYPTASFYAPGDAEMDILADILAGGKNSRLYKKLVYELGIAQDVSAFQGSRALESMFVLTATARPGHTLEELLSVIDAEIEGLKVAPPTERELERSVNQREVSMLRSYQSLLAKADALNQYYYYTGNPDYANEDLNRYRSLSTDDLSVMARRYLSQQKRVLLSIVPEGQTELAVSKKDIKP